MRTALSAALLAVALLSGCGLGLRHRITEGPLFTRLLRSCGHLLGTESYEYSPRVVGPHRVATREGGCRRWGGGCISESREAYFADDPDRYFDLESLALDDALAIARAYFAGHIEGETGLNEYDHFNAIRRRGDEVVLEFDQCASSGSEVVVALTERAGEPWLVVRSAAQRTWEE